MSLTVKDFSETLSILTDFKPDPKIVVAFSGGCDSLALLLLCSSAVGKENVKAVYVNHKIRTDEELTAEIELNKRNCIKAGVDFSVIELDKDELEKTASMYGTEAAARTLRYRALEDFASTGKFDFIATAHHFDDQIETLLMRVCSNSPVPSMRGIAEKKGRVIRPLLEFRKKELEDYVSSLKYSWSIDSTNSDNSIRRNEIRNCIIPELKNVMPDYEERLLCLKSMAFKLCESDEKVRLQMRLFRMWDEKFNTQLPQSLTDRVYDAMHNGRTNVVSANGGTFSVCGERIILVDEAENRKFAEFSECVKPEECCLALADGSELVITAEKRNNIDLCIDFSKTNGFLKLRYAQTGDRIVLKDGSKMVLRLLQDMKIPSVLRCRVPVLTDDGEVVAVLGSAVGGKDRICSKLRTSLAVNFYYVYIKNTEL